MTLKEFAEKIINNEKLHDYVVLNGSIELDDDISDESRLNIHDGIIEVITYYVYNIETL